MNEELKYPVMYNLRVIYSGSAEVGINKISSLLKDLSIELQKSEIKPGGKGNLTRLGFLITVISKEQLDSLYSNLGTIPEIKWAT